MKMSSTPDLLKERAAAQRAFYREPHVYHVAVTKSQRAKGQKAFTLLTAMGR